jgi:RNA polymerase sigma factor (TIGR02999 family)
MHEEVTQILGRVQLGDRSARDRLIELIYVELRRMAYGLMQKERPDHTLQPTALVHEALIRLIDSEVLRKSPNRKYLFAAAAQCMRQILVDHVRNRSAQKRGGAYQRVALDAVADAIQERYTDIIAIHEALERLEQLEPRQGQIITLRIFGGLTVREIAGQLGVSESTVHDELKIARAWLHAQLMGDE